MGVLLRKEDGKIDSFEEFSEYIEVNLVKGVVFDDKLGDKVGGVGGGEDESIEVGGVFVGESVCGVD